MTNMHQRQWRFLFALPLASLGCLASISTATAQITPDRTLGAESSRVTPDTINGVESDRLDGGARRGANLFHSFREFNVGEGRGAYFTNPTGIENILSRVTGGKASRILGTLGVLGDANLFLINPNGIVFGPNARLDVGGAFVGTTASGVRLGETGQFSATEPQSGKLLAIQPSALFFNAPGAGGITNRSQVLGVEGATNTGGAPVGLQVPDGQTLALVGGEMLLEGGNLTAAGGRIELGSVAGVGEVSLGQSGQSWIANYEDIQAFGTIRLQSGSLVNASGAGGGDVQVQGARFEMRGSFLFADTLGSEAGGEVLVQTTEAVSLRDGSLLTADVLGSGDGGNIRIETGQLSMQDEAAIFANISGEGDGGSLTVKASDSVELVGGQFPSGFSTETVGEGKAGDVSLETGRLTLRDGGAINAGTAGSGDGGTLTVNASESVEIIGGSVNDRFPSGLFAQTVGEGDAGDLILNTEHLLVRDGAQIGASTLGSGDGGTLTISVSESVSLIGTTADRQFPSGLFANTAGGGNGGTLSLETKHLSVRDGAQVAVTTFGSGNGGTLTINVSESVELIGRAANEQYSSGLFTVTQGGGEAGDLSLNTEHLSVRDGARISASTLGEGDGGTLTVNASESVELIGSSADGQFPSSLSTSTQGAGRAGNIALSTPQTTIRSGAQISAETDGGAGNSITITGQVLEATQGGQILTTTSSSNDAGDITLFLEERLLLSGTDSGVLANTTEGSSGNGGSIFIDPQTVTIQDGASIAVNSQGTGIGGNITLQAGSLTLDNATLSAETASNTGGNISLALQDLLVLIENSQISATAGTNRTGGDGGNIDINAELIAAADNSDLSANAFAGSGGNIDLTAQGIVGLEVRNQLTSRSDITALSQQNPNLSGQIALNTPDVDPSRELVEFPETVVNPSEQIAQNACQRGRESEFAITGRGGLPSRPSDLLSSEATGVDLVEAAPMDRSADLKPDTAEESHRPPAVSQTIKPAQGWAVNDKGEVVLTAAHSTSIQRLPSHPNGCSAQLN